MLIPLDKLVSDHSLRISGVLHLGAHLGEEAAAYQAVGASRVIWIEGNPELIPELTRAVSAYPGHEVHNLLVADRDSDAVLKVANNSQASSLLDFGSHKEHHPEVCDDHRIEARTQRLDGWIRANQISLENINFLNIDLQGAELMALKGLGRHLDAFEAVYTEVNTGSVYIGCPSLFEMDRFLAARGFLRVALKLTQCQWGDALYLRGRGSLAGYLFNLGEALYHQWSYPVMAGFGKWIKACKALVRRVFPR